MTDTILAKVQELISQSHGIDAETITMDKTFDQLGMDSLDGLALIGDLEEAFGVSIPNQDVLEIRNIRQAVEALEKIVHA